MNKIAVLMIICTGCFFEREVDDLSIRIKTDESNDSSEEELRESIIANDLKGIRKILRRKGICYYNAMSVGIEMGNREVIDLIFARKVGINNKEFVDELLEEPSKLVSLMLLKGNLLYNEVMERAAKGGNIKLVKLMIKKGANDYNWALINAGDGGHMEIVELMLKRGAIKYNTTMAVAAFKGRMEVVKLMLEKGADDYNGALRGAAEGGHLDILILMLKKGANDYNEAMMWAAIGGNLEIIKLLMRKGANNFNRALGGAADGGHINILHFLMEKGADDYNEAMRWAANKGNIEIVKLMLDKGADDYNGALEEASDLLNKGSDYKEIIDLMLERGATNYGEAMRWAFRKDYIDTLKLAVEKGIDNYLMSGWIYSFCKDETSRIILSAYWEKTKERAMEEGLKEEFLLIKNSVKLPVSGYFYEQKFLLSSVENQLKGREGHFFAFPNNFPHELVAEIFKHLDIRSRIELIFLYSPRDLGEDELKFIEENEWNEYMPINVRDANGITMLHKLCYYGHRNKVDFLVGKGVLKNIENNEKKRPLWYSIKGAKDGKYEKDEKFIKWVDKLKRLGFN